MKTTRYIGLACAAMAFATTGNASVIPLTAGNVSASTELGGNFNRTVDQIVDGSGLSGGQHTTLDPNNTMWLSNGTGNFGGEDTDPFVLFDLGDVYTITSFQVWNYNELAGSLDLTTRGVRNVSVEYGLTEALGSTVPGITQFAQADATNTYAGEVFNVNPFNARYIKFDIESGLGVGNYGDTNLFYGLSEVQFTGTLVPEPGSLALLAFGGVLLARRRRA